MPISVEKLIKFSATNLHKHYFKNEKLRDYFVWEEDPAREYADRLSISPYRRMGNSFKFEDITFWFIIDEIIYLNHVTYLLHYPLMPNAWNKWVQRDNASHALALQVALARQEGKLKSHKNEEDIYRIKIGDPLTQKLWMFDKMWDLEFDSIEIINYYLYKASVLNSEIESIKYDAQFNQTKARNHFKKLVKLTNATSFPQQWDWSPMIF